MNPFKDQGDLLPITSINRLYVEDKKAYDLFHSALIKEDLLHVIRQISDENLEHSTLSELMAWVDHSQNILLQKEVNHIITHYGKALAQILGTLFKPSERSINNHQEWSATHVDYWTSIETLYLAGGAIIHPFVKPFKREIQKELKQRNVSKHIHFLLNSEDLGMRGMASLHQDDGTLLIFDLGQTSIKRAFQVNHNGIKNYQKLPSIPAKFLFTDEPTDKAILNSAKELHHYLVDSILKTIVDHHINPSHLYISIANYVHKGCLQRGKSSYGKLDLIGHPYDIYIQEELKNAIGYEIHVRLFHDTSAMALNYKEQTKVAVISIGTAFGVGFTED